MKPVGHGEGNAAGAAKTKAAPPTVKPPKGTTNAGAAGAGAAAAPSASFPACPAATVASMPGLALGSASGLAAVDTLLSGDTNFLGGVGAGPSSADAELYDALAKHPKEALDLLPNLKRWSEMVGLFMPFVRSSWPPLSAPLKVPKVSEVAPAAAAAAAPQKAAAAAPAAAKAAAAEEEDNDDEMDWGDDDEDAGPKEAVVHPSGSRAAIAAEAKAKRDAETEKKKEEAMARLAKKEANQRSLCNLEIKPWEASQDLKALYAKIKETVVLDGLKWSENCALVDVAFGVQKIVCTAVIPLSLSMDAIIDEMTEDTFADEIQSMNMTSMSLL
jgi:translation elongation factor EF-1beta